MKYVIQPNEEVKIINGAFKGICGYIESVKMSVDENVPVHIRVDKRNCIEVDIKDIEVIYDDYLVYKAKENTGEPIEILGKFRLKKSEVSDFLMRQFRKYSPYSYSEYNESNFLNSCYVHRCDFCMKAVPLDKVEFEFIGKKLSIDEIKKIVQ